MLRIEWRSFIMGCIFCAGILALSYFLNSPTIISDQTNPSERLATHAALSDAVKKESLQREEAWRCDPHAKTSFPCTLVEPAEEDSVINPSDSFIEEDELDD